MVKVSEKLNESKGRVKRELSYDIKKRIVNAWNSKKKENPKYTRAMLSALFEEELGFKIANSTISDIVKNQGDILAAGDNIEFRYNQIYFVINELGLNLNLKQIQNCSISRAGRLSFHVPNSASRQESVCVGENTHEESSGLRCFL